MLDEDGDPVTGLTCDSEISKNGDTGADCTNEGVEIPYTTATNKGMYYLILTAAEMTADVVAVTVYSGATTTQATCITLYPRKLVSLRAGTSAGGDTAYITLDANASAIDDWYNGCLCVATIDSGVEARIISDYTGSNKRAAVTPAWNVAPDSDDTFIIYLTEGVQVNQANLTHINGAAQTATLDTIKAETALIVADTGTDGVLISSGTGAKQIALTSGAVLLQATQTGVTIPTVTTLTNLPTAPTDWLTAAAVKADAVTKIQANLALEGTQTAIKGAGWSTETLAAIDVLIDAIKAKTDLITTGTTVTIASPVSGSTITAQRGDSLSAALTNIGDLTNYSKLWFTAKKTTADLDTSAIVQIEHTAGLTYINGAVAITPANGTLAIDDETTGDVTIGLAAVEMAKLDPGKYVYDIQVLRSTGTPVSTLTEGTFIVPADVTRTTA
jgi:hypothetical protein